VLHPLRIDVANSFSTYLQHRQQSSKKEQTRRVTQRAHARQIALLLL
jgi:hypothetical protein